MGKPLGTDLGMSEYKAMVLTQLVQNQLSTASS